MLKEKEMKRVLVLVAIVLAMGVAGCGGGPATPSPTDTPLPPSPTPEPTPTPITVAGIIEALTPSTVLIQAEFPDEWVTGTGIIYDESGLTLTNAHVVEGAAIIKAYIQGIDRWLSAQIVGISTCEDLAVIDISGEGDVPATLGESYELTLGEDVIAMGYPLASALGADLTINRGVVSKLHVELDEFTDLIQTDTDINPGNSGGPLVNMRGEVVGINALKFEYTATGRPVSGLNFAIPSSHAKPIIERLASGENVLWIGANAITNDADVAWYFDLPVEEGLYMYGVSDNSPTAKAGIEAGDVLITMKGINLYTMADVCDILRSNPEGNPVAVEVVRGTKVLEGEIWGEKLSVTSEVGPTISPFTFAEAVDENDNCLNPATIFPSGTTQVYTCWNYSGMQDGMAVRMVWLRDGQNFDEGSDTWQGGQEGVWWWSVGDEAGLSPGTYEVQFYVEGQLAQSDTFTITGVEVSPTPQPSPQVSPTPQPSPQTGLLYSDDFSDPSSGWLVSSSEDTEKGYSEGEYYVLVNKSGIVSWGYPGRTFTDFRLEVDARKVAGPDYNDFGVIVRYRDADNFYSFDLRSDGYYAVLKLVNDQWETLVNWTTSPHINQGESANHLTLIVQGANLSFSVNGEHLADVTDASFAEGDIGLFAAALDEAGVRIHFDNLEVWSLE